VLGSSQATCRWFGVIGFLCCTRWPLGWEINIQVHQMPLQVIGFSSFWSLDIGLFVCRSCFLCVISYLHRCRSSSRPLFIFVFGPGGSYPQKLLHNPALPRKESRARWDQHVLWENKMAVLAHGAVIFLGSLSKAIFKPLLM